MISFCATAKTCLEPHLVNHSNCAETDAGSREYVMDSDFRWAQDDYNNTQRSIEIWAFIIQLRVRLTLMNQKWNYVGGYTDDK